MATTILGEANSLHLTMTTTTTTPAGFHLSPLPTIVASKYDPDQIRHLLQAYPLPRNQRKFMYGTAGFRQVADADLQAVVVRTAASVVIQCWQQQQQQRHGDAMGIMITASHNDESYNGIKIANTHGGMLDPIGERKAVSLVNERDDGTIWEYIVRQRRLLEQKTKDDRRSIDSIIHIGRDTRVHSIAFRNILVRMIIAMGGRVIDHGICTTPMLHHAVLHDNFVRHLPATIPPRPNVGGYLDLIAYSYLALCATASPATSRPTPTLLVDCACGVGYPALQALCGRLRTIGIPTTKQIVPTNGPGMGPLNEGCGSEYVQKEQRSPHWYDETLVADTDYCAALDGDADRIVFFAKPKTGGGDDDALKLLDGDKISCLFCKFIQEQLAKLDPHGIPIRLGVVQTAYANGASTAFLRSLLGIPNVLISKTGVKHVHRAARAFDIGVYFESNGHGTIVFGTNFYEAVALLDSKVKAGDDAIALKRLQLLPALVNQAVGDALSDLLLVDAILTLQGLSLDDWYHMYHDLPSRQSKVMIPDRTLIQTNDNETQCTKPVGMQEELDKVMQAMGGRTFVRPSGTEDVVRVYAEGPSQTVADSLAKRAEQIVRRFTIPSKM